MLWLTLKMARAQQEGELQTVDAQVLVGPWSTPVLFLERQQGLLFQHHQEAMELLQPI